MSRELHSLEALTGMTLDAGLAPLKAISDGIRAGQAQIAALEERCATRAAVVNAQAGAPDPALLAGQDARWLGWVQAERARINSEIAEAASRREAQRVVARRAFGRVEAIGALSRWSADEARRLAARRAMNAL